MNFRLTVCSVEPDDTPSSLRPGNWTGDYQSEKVTRMLEVTLTESEWHAVKKAVIEAMP